MRYRLTIESQAPVITSLEGDCACGDPANKNTSHGPIICTTPNWGGKVTVEFNSAFTIDADLVDWIKQEIDAQAEVSAPE